MGRYIIELEDNESVYKTIIKKDPMIQAFELLSPTPYIEPDLEKIRKEAYEKGYCIGYSKYLNKSYEDGLKDAWEAARKIVLDKNKGGILLSELQQIFHKGLPTRIIEVFSASEAIEKIRQYEQEQEKNQAWR